MNDNYYEIERFEELSTRSKNIVNEMGGLDQVVRYFRMHGNFLNIRNSGRKSNYELCSISRYSIENETWHETPQEQIENDNVVSEELLEKYQFFKLQLSARANNILTKIENEFKLSDGGKGLSSLVAKLLNGKIEFLNQRSCGRQTANELKEMFQVKLPQIALTLSSIPLTPEELLNKSICQLMSPEYSDRSKLLSNGLKYNFVGVVCLYLYVEPRKKTRWKVLKEYYFGKSDATLDLIGELVSCTRERVRQIIAGLDSLVENAIYFVSDKVCGEPCFWPVSELTMDVAVIDISGDVLPEQFGITPNERLIREIISIYGRKSHVLVNDILLEHKPLLKALNYPSSLLFFRREKAEIFDLNRFILWSDLEIYNLKRIEAEFDVEVLVERYYDLHEITLDRRDIKILASFLSDNIRSFEGSAEVRKGERELRKSTIVNLVRECISEAGVPVKTEVLLNFIIDQSIEISRMKLLSLLNKEKDSFAMFGSGKWALAEWRQEGMIGGSIRDITISLLSKSDVPLHFSEILDYLNKYSETFLNSLRTNLRSGDAGMFIFFNCGFVGLKSKNYAQKWTDLPKIVGSHFNADVLHQAHIVSKGRIEEYYERKYQYPPKHTRFLIDGN